jgi:hypothetical protein
MGKQEILCKPGVITRVEVVREINPEEGNIVFEGKDLNPEKILEDLCLRTQAYAISYNGKKKVEIVLVFNTGARIAMAINPLDFETTMDVC